MPKFVDCLGREWTLRLTLGHETRLRELGVDTADFARAMATLIEQTSDVHKVAAVCHLLTVETVDFVDYSNGWDVDTIEAAGNALADAVVDFFHGRTPRIAAAMKAKVREVVEKTDEKAADKLTRLPWDIGSPESPE